MKLRVMKPLTPIFHREPGQCQISEYFGFGFVISDLIQSAIHIPHSEIINTEVKTRRISIRQLADNVIALLQKGGVPAAPSGTATLLRLSPSH